MKLYRLNDGPIHSKSEHYAWMRSQWYNELDLHYMTEQSFAQLPEFLKGNAKEIIVDDHLVWVRHGSREIMSQKDYDDMMFRRYARKCLQEWKATHEKQFLEKDFVNAYGKDVFQKLLNCFFIARTYPWRIEDWLCICSDAEEREAFWKEYDEMYETTKGT